MRHKNVEKCPVGALAMYLMYRYEIQKETPPNTLVNSEWYHLYLLQADKRTMSLRNTLSKKKKDIPAATVARVNVDVDDGGEDPEGKLSRSTHTSRV